jgi:hypothetical protein
MTENNKKDLQIDEITIKMPIIKDPTDPVNQVQHVVDRGGNLDNYHWIKHNWYKGGVSMGAALIQNDTVDADKAKEFDDIEVFTYDGKRIHVGDTIEWHSEVGLESRIFVCLVGYGYEVINRVMRYGLYLEEGENYPVFLSQHKYDPAKIYLRDYQK